MHFNELLISYINIKTFIHWLWDIRLLVAAFIFTAFSLSFIKIYAVQTILWLAADWWDLISVQIVLPKNERHVSQQVCHVMKFEFTGWQKIQNLKDYLHFLPSNQFKIYNMTLQLVTWTCVSIWVRFRYKYLFIWHVMKHVLVGYSRRKYSTLKFSKCLTYLYNIWLWQIATLLH